MNPSASGWVEKFFSEHYLTDNVCNTDIKDFYLKCRKTGFIYGYVVGFDIQKNINTKGWFLEEKTKVALLNTLYGCFKTVCNKTDFKEFSKSVLEFYDILQPKEYDWFDKILPTDSDETRLDKKINARIKTNDNVFSKNFSHILTNALLFIDILAYRKYLLGNKNPEKYILSIEEIITATVLAALSSKVNPTSYDQLLIKLFKSSLRYTKINFSEYKSINDIDYTGFDVEPEKYYILDLACMTVWNDETLETEENNFLYELGKKLNLNNDVIYGSIKEIDSFISLYQNEIPYFNYSNPVKHFYGQTSQQIVTLLNRNRKRLVKEISQSKELMLLITRSTQRELTETEKKKVRKQLLDICKSIPSLTIFLLPGGSLLLPLLIKFIPQILPSSFNENLEE
ncbi:MAG: LETM1-related biofilm-associated protein [Flavobacteriaceae bacterium]|jgi:hypothetical protein|nr:LETM1-related biofilm-associated protein [Flavobacteriaceae bacterium]